MALRADLEILRDSLERCNKQLDEIGYAAKSSEPSTREDILTEES